MKILYIIVKIVLFLLDRLKENELMKQGEYAYMRVILNRVVRRMDVAKNISDNADRLSDDWLQPDKFNGNSERILPDNEVHKR